ncbi:hypothetical protein EVAR_20910_1 [Eumeta japonica]|uniref:Uncharacterized protein n=1 Tax=Eumeta variegata TaxID=151549 RepID=A0A4C1UWR1_EUMVA|nr:hypothetical protein EVAR_20910_1 [Eumeta japonica]
MITSSISREPSLESLHRRVLESGDDSSPWARAHCHCTYRFVTHIRVCPVNAVSSGPAPPVFIRDARSTSGEGRADYATRTRRPDALGATGAGAAVRPQPR